jgi:hypothetical protein
LAVGYHGMSDGERRTRVKDDYEMFLTARAEILAEAAHRVCEGKALDLGALFNGKN